MRVYDILIAGAGVTGLALALGLKRSCPAAAVAVVDPAGLPDGAAAPRTLRAVAVAAGPRRFLDDLGVWGAVAAYAQPIHDMRITDSRPDDAPRPVFLDFAGEAGPDEPFAFMLLQDDLRQALVRACRAAGVVALSGRITDFRREAGALRIDGPVPGTATRLLVAADGARSRLRGLAGIGTVGWDYGQAGVVATIAHERPHEGRATQHFLPGGPLAVLPLRAENGSDRRFSLVWTERSLEAERLAGLPPSDFIEALEAKIGFDYGPLRLEDRPSAHPLRLILPRRLVAPRLALLGDAARSIHPLAGQGLNLGLRDVAVLVEALTEALDLGLDPGEASLLRAYERARRFDSIMMAAATDALNRLFSNDSLPARLIRDFGLGLVDRIPGVKRFFIRDAAGLSGDVPAPFRRSSLT
jgi:2-octaprenyl-6-methoxyphenol hydroxylase